MRQSIELRFLYRPDVLFLIGVVILAESFLAVIRQADLPSMVRTYGKLDNPDYLALSCLDMLVLWFLTLTVTRARLTCRHGIALWRLDRGALQSLGVNALVQVIPAGMTGLVIPEIITALGGNMAFSLKLGGSCLLGLLCVFWVWLTVRCFVMSYIAWESGHAGFRIAQSYKAMKGYVWSYVFWSVVLTVPFALTTVLVQKTAVFALSGSYLIGASVIVTTMIVVANNILSRNFDLLFFQALRPDWV